MTQELVGAGKMLSKGVLRAIWLEKNHCWREFVTFYYAFLESHSLPHHNFSQVQRSFLLWNIYSTLVPLPGEREIDTLLCILESVQDFLIKLDMKPCMHLVEIRFFFSLNNFVVRPTKIMNNFFINDKICTFKVTFQHQKSMEFFWTFFSVKNIRPGDQLWKRKFFESFDF